MSAPSTADLLRHHTDLLLATLEQSAQDDLEAPSLCQGWTRGHVVTHLARNADALARAVAGLVENSAGSGSMYPSNQARDREIEEGARTIERIPGAGPRIPGRVLGALRLNEVVLHHTDLDLRFGFADVDDPTVERLLDLAVAAWDPARGLTLRSTEGDERAVGDGALAVRGSRRGILAYLTRQLDDAVTVDERTSR